MRQLFSRVVSKNANWHERAGRTSARTHHRPISACWTALFPGIAVITFANRSGLIRAVESYSGDAKPGSEASECARRGLARCPPRGNSRGSCAGIGNDAKAHRRRLTDRCTGRVERGLHSGGGNAPRFRQPARRSNPVFRGRPPRLPFSRAAFAFAGEVVEPARRARADIHAALPNMPETRRRTSISRSISGQYKPTPPPETTT